MNSIGLALIAGLLAGCAEIGEHSQLVSATQSRELTPAEKVALARMVSVLLKNPDSAEFKWMPVILSERDGITHYCGLVNDKDSSSTYVGFTRFYAQLKKDDEGQFTAGVVRAVEPHRKSDPIEPRWLNGICERYGYTDFALAN